MVATQRCYLSGNEVLLRSLIKSDAVFQSSHQDRSSVTEESGGSLFRGLLQVYAIASSVQLLQTYRY